MSPGSHVYSHRAFCLRDIIHALDLPGFCFSGMSKQRLSTLQSNAVATGGLDADLLPPFHPYQPLECIVEETEGKLNELGQRISAIEKAQLQSLELIQGEPLTKDKIEELKKSREEQVQKKKKILKELQKVERQLQLKTQQQLSKEYMEGKMKDEPGQAAGVEAPGTPLPPQATQLGSSTGCKDDNKVEDHQQLPLDEDDEDGEEDDEDEDDEDGDYAELPQVDTILGAPQPAPPLPPQPHSLQGPPPPPLQSSFVPIQPMNAQQSTDFGSAEYPDSSSPDLQRVMLGQQLSGLGPGLLAQAPDGLMVATPAQTLTDTLDDIMAGMFRSSRRLYLCRPFGTVCSGSHFCDDTHALILVCSSEQQSAYVKHYNLTHTSAHNTGAHEHCLPTLHAPTLSICRHRCTCKP